MTKPCCANRYFPTGITCVDCPYRVPGARGTRPKQRRGPTYWQAMLAFALAAVVTGAIMLAALGVAQ